MIVNLNESYFMYVCFSNDSDSIFINCGHGGICL